MSPAGSPDARWLCLPAVPESSSRSRDFIRTTFEEWGLGGLDDALLLVSELASNVVRHAGTPMVVGVVWRPVEQTVRVSVRDDVDTAPSVRPADALAVSGRGLHIVAALAQDWGVQQLSVGKIVWFELPVTPSVPAALAAQ